MKTRLKKLLSYLMFVILIAMMFHFIFNFVKTPDSTAVSVIKQFSTIYLVGSLSLLVYFIWGNAVHDF
jgi:hypothetical protein